MAKDYFQDIIPPGDSSVPLRAFKPRPLPPDTPEEEGALNIPIQVMDTVQNDEHPGDAPARGIRSISAPPRMRPVRQPELPNIVGRDFREGPPIYDDMPPHRSSRLWMWAGASVLVLSIVAALLFFFGSTTITITPKSRIAVLNSAAFIAREGAAAPAGTLSYTMQTFDLEDSEVVEAKGTTRVESKASGSIVVSNAYSATQLTFVKNTRFESPEGLIYRAVSDVVVPAKKGATAGTVSITVVADEVGEKYNIGPTARFTLPGLKSNAQMFAAVSAKSVAPMQGGAAGEQPGTAPGALEAAVALVRGRLETKAYEAAAGQAKDDTFVFPELISITYESLPTTKEAGDSVRIHEKAHVEIPVLPKDVFAQEVAKVAFTDSESVPVSMEPGEDFTVHVLAPGDDGQSGTLNLVASGKALIIWEVDTAAIATALEGKDSSAFQAIVNGFPSVLEARARISPFWKNSFPAEASDIKVVVEKPSATE